MKKRLLALLLTLCMVVSLLPAQLVAAEGEKKVAHPIEICYASDPKPLGIDFLRNALSNIELPEWAEIGKPTDLLLLSVPLSATKLGTNNSSSNGYIKRL